MMHGIIHYDPTLGRMRQEPGLQSMTLSLNCIQIKSKGKPNYRVARS